MGYRFKPQRGKRAGYWYVDISWPDGIRTTKAVPDEATAIKLNKKVEVAIVDEERIWKKLRKELRTEEGILQGFSQFADLYYQSYVLIHNRSPRSKKSRLDILKRHFSSMPIDTITPQHIDKFISNRRKDGAGNATINRDLVVLSHLYQWAIKRGHLESNPVDKIERLKEIEYVGERPDESIIDAIFAKIHPAILPVFVFMRETGCRRGEALSLKRSQIDFNRAIVVFHSQTKNGKSRQVPLTEAALCAISNMQKHGETVFYHPGTLRKWTQDSIKRPWQTARAKTGSELRIHDLRHAYAIGLAEAGCAMHYISEVLGHHSIDFTRKHYARFSPESASRAVLRVLEGRKTATGS